MPAEKLAELPAKQKEGFEKIAIRRLLTMSVGGFPFRPFLENENGSQAFPDASWLDFSLACEIKDPETKAFNYSNINSYLVGVALTEILGRDLGGFIEEKIFAPLGIERFAYTRCPEGYFYGASEERACDHAAL